MTETIQTWKAKNRKGAIILRRHYDQLSSFILAKLRHTDGITLLELIKQANAEIAKDFGGSISYLLLLVKKDLEVMRIITIENLPDRTQFISLKRKSARKTSYMDKVRKVQFNPNKN